MKDINKDELNLLCPIEGCNLYFSKYVFNPVYFENPLSQNIKPLIDVKYCRDKHLEKISYKIKSGIRIYKGPVNDIVRRLIKEKLYFAMEFPIPIDRRDVWIECCKAEGIIDGKIYWKSHLRLDIYLYTLLFNPEYFGKDISEHNLKFGELGQILMNPEDQVRINYLKIVYPELQQSIETGYTKEKKAEKLDDLISRIKKTGKANSQLIFDHKAYSEEIKEFINSTNKPLKTLIVLIIVQISMVSCV